MIDLLNPDRKALLDKWRWVIESVRHANQWDTEAEIAWICEAASRSRFYLELGAFRGASTKAAALANPELSIAVLDTWDDPGTFDDFSKLLAPELDKGKVYFCRGSTDEGFKRISNLWFDFAFVDACHLYDGVKSDIKNTLPLMLKESILAGHDFRRELPDDGVTKAVTEEFGSDFSLPVDSIWAVQL